MNNTMNRSLAVVMAMTAGFLMCISGRLSVETHGTEESGQQDIALVEEFEQAVAMPLGAADEIIPPLNEIATRELAIEAISVSCLKVEWNAETGREYVVEVETDALFKDNITIVKKGNGLVYLTGLRENSEYEVTVTPVPSGKEESEGYIVIPSIVSGKTLSVVREKEYDHEDGWTGVFAGERASGLVNYPSYDAIIDTTVDTITDTGIRRNECGDYCCAMGLWYGEVGDRFLVELENGIQFTVQICDSKGMASDADGDGEPDGRFHWFGDKEGKCIIEFIYDNENLPDNVLASGSWGYFEWNGLDLRANIKSIHKISADTGV